MVNVFRLLFWKLFFIIGTATVVCLFTVQGTLGAIVDPQKCEPPKPAPWAKEVAGKFKMAVLPFRPSTEYADPLSHAQHKNKWDRQRRNVTELGWHGGAENASFGDGYFGLTIYSASWPSSDRQVVNAPIEVLWCVLRRGDAVLLSDELTHHYTHVFDVDRTGNTVTFIDNFPREIFLKKGRNVSDIEALELDHGDGNVLIQISRPELFRVLRSVSTAADLPFVDYYFEMYPPALQDPSTQFAIASSILRNRMAYPFDANLLRLQKVSDLLRKSMDLAHDSGNDDLVTLGAGDLHNVLQIQNALLLLEMVGLRSRAIKEALQSRTDPEVIHRLKTATQALSETEADITTLVRRYGEEQLYRGYEADDYFRLGCMLSQIPEQYDLAEQFLRRALAIAPHYDEVYLFRSIWRSNKRDLLGAIDDARRGISLIEIDERETISRIEEYWIKGVEPATADKVWLTLLRTRNKAFIKTLYSAHKALGNIHAAEDDKRLLKALHDRFIDRHNAELLRSVEAFYDGDLYTAYRHWLALADTDHIERRIAERSLGELYAGGPAIIAITSDNAQMWDRRMQTFSKGDQNFFKTFKKDMVEAENWWMRAAEHGDGIAAYQLGIVYERGDAKEGQNLPVACLWLRLSSALGHDKAPEALESLNTKMTLAQQSEVETLLKANLTEGGLSPNLAKGLDILQRRLGSRR